MSGKVFSGLFVCEGTSDLPLADIVEKLFIEREIDVRLSKPDYALLGKVEKDTESRVRAGIMLLGGAVDLVVVHRDADSAGPNERRNEIARAVSSVCPAVATVPVIPVRMTEAWLLLDEDAIRHVAGNPRGRAALSVPALRRIEAVSDPKHLLQECLVKAADCSGRRRERVVKRFNEHRRQLLQRVDHLGPINELPSWRQLVADVESAAVTLAAMT